MECIDYFLTQKNELISTFLPVPNPKSSHLVELKVHYVNREELEEHRGGKKGVPKLRDFEFIKVLGTGGFATVYMGK